MIRAYCFASGLIEFGKRIPAGAIIIARGPEKELRDFIETKARHGYRTRHVNGRPTKIPGSDTLLVPGVPEALSQWDAGTALRAWSKWIAIGAPKGVRVLSS
ncbi:MAG TPA: host nuclease inhibitor protein [Dehalococcoidia bacterium]